MLRARFLSKNKKSRLIAVSNNGYDERIYLRGDGSADYEAVMKVMARVNAAGFSNLGLVTDPVVGGQ
jgi:biopolymer transport protein TolR